MKIFLLYYDTDNGDREEWNTFYTPVEAFTTDGRRECRKKELVIAVDEHGNPKNYCFHELNVELNETPYH